MGEDDENIFEEYYPYIGAVETPKEDLMKHFKCFLEHPEHGGIFVIRWKENDTYKNRFSFDEYIKQINTKIEGD